MREIKFESGAELSHAYIIASPSRTVREAKATEIAAAALCTETGTVPCMACRACRKVREGIHPDLIHIKRQDAQGKKNGEKKQNVSVDQMRELIADASIAPNESHRKVYIIDEAELMNVNAQNAALKLLEEPPVHTVLVLCTPSADALLATVRSRCTEINCNSERDAFPEEIIKMRNAYLRCAASDDAPKLFEWCMLNNGTSKADAIAFTLAVTEKLAEMLTGESDVAGMSADKIYRLIELQRKCTLWLNSNVGVKHIFALLATQTVTATEEI